MKKKLEYGSQHGIWLHSAADHCQCMLHYHLLFNHSNNKFMSLCVIIVIGFTFFVEKLLVFPLPHCFIIISYTYITGVDQL